MSFEEWLKYVFDRPVEETPWYWGDDIEELSAQPYINFGTRLLRESGRCLAPYSDGQVQNGLYFIFSNSSSDQVFALTDESIPLDRRLEFLRAIFDLNRDCFEPRCTPHLSHLDYSGTPEEVSPLNAICYLLWDIFIIWGDREKPAHDPLNRACLRVMEQCLTLSNLAVQEGALHGLGHFEMNYPDDSHRIIDAFLGRTGKLSPDLRSYGECARTGQVL